MKRTIAMFLAFTLLRCVTVPDRLEPVQNFELDRYLGTWYEIARLDHSFERGLSRVTATYGKREDGGVSVLNRGFDREDQEWDQAEGKAYFVQDANTGFLKVSFFGPFYGSYIILDLDKKDYKYAMICGPNRNYFWILSRTPKMDDKLLKTLVQEAREMGFETDKLIYVEQ